MSGKRNSILSSPWFWVPTLYFAEGIPYFVVNNISVTMFKRLGMGNAELAAWTSLLYLPWVIKPLWSPLVDVLRTKRWWILVMQFLMTAGFAALSLSVSPDAFGLSLVIFYVIAFASATHDIAADGFYMLALDTHRQSVFVGIRSTFYRIASVFGQGVIVVVAGLLEERMADIPAAWTTTLAMSAALFGALAVWHLFSLPKELSGPAGTNGTVTVSRQQAGPGPEAYPTEANENWPQTQDGRAVKAGDVAQTQAGPGPEAYPTKANENWPQTQAGRAGRNETNVRIEAGNVAQTQAAQAGKAGDVAQMQAGRAGRNETNVRIEAGDVAQTQAAKAEQSGQAGPANTAGHHGTAQKLLEVFVTFFRKPGIWAALLFMLLYRLPEAFSVKMLTPFMLDPIDKGGLGLSTAQSGLVYGTVGVIALTLGGILGGLASARFGLRKTIWPMALALALPCGVYLYMAAAQPASLWIVYTCVAFDQFGYGFGFTAYLLYMMYFSEGEFKTSHYALCTAFMALSMMLPGLVAGVIQEAVGYVNFFVIVMVCCLCTVAVTLWVRRKISPEYGLKNIQK